MVVLGRPRPWSFQGVDVDQSQPNILLIMTDQQAPDMMSCTGNDWVSTPAMDGLVAEGRRFEHAICSNPVCLPSRISMATGLMPSQLGVTTNSDGRDADLPPRIAENSLGMLMKRAGYDTYYGGKVHLCPQLEPAVAGYDRSFPNERMALADDLIAFIGQGREAPFFAVASFINPHDICYVHNAKTDRDPRMASVTSLYEQATLLPDRALPPLPGNYEIPPEEPAGTVMRYDETSITPSGTMSATYSRRDWQIYRWVYARLTEEVDFQIGRILAALRATGLEKETVVIFTSDHGNMHANHRLSSKFSFYRESVGVPFVLSWPGVIRGGEVDTDSLVNIGLDILPTCCDYAGIEAPHWLRGRSLRPVAEHKHGRFEPAYVMSENRSGTMIQTAAWKYVKYASGEPSELLIDLENDPGEMGNLAGSDADAHAAQLTTMREAMARMKASDLVPMT